MKTEAPEKLSVDEQFLKDFLAKGGKAETTTGAPVDDSNVDAFLEEVGGKPRSDSRQQELHERALAKEAADTTREQQQAAEKEQTRNAKLQAEAEKQRQNTIERGISHGTKAVNENIVSPVIDRTGALVDKVSSLSTYGGVGLLLAILVFLLLVVVQVNGAGDTRLKQFWYMLNGRSSLSGRVDLVAADSGASSGATSTGDGTLALADISLLSDYRMYTA